MFRFPSLDPEKYEMDEDGLPRAIVGAWTRDKHDLVRRYLDISWGVRRMFLEGGGGATFIDLFAGPGKARIENSAEVVDGSAVVAWKESVRTGTAFSEVLVGDLNGDLATAANTRLGRAGAKSSCFVGPASETSKEVSTRVSRHGLHVILLDPYGLRDLPFEVIGTLAKLAHPDILIHISALALRRNMWQFSDPDNSTLDQFAPNWRAAVDCNSSDDVLIRGKVLEYWTGLLRAEGMKFAETAAVRTPQGQLLYWLGLAARHDRAIEFWNKIKPNRQRSLF
jgi:three-Cys-motif partner protein